VGYCIVFRLIVICFMSIALCYYFFVFYYTFQVCFLVVYVLLSILKCSVLLHCFSSSIQLLLFHVCTSVLPQSGNPIAVNKYIISYTISYHKTQTQSCLRNFMLHNSFKNNKKKMLKVITFLKCSPNSSSQE
jgi:hypothetical protein